MQPSTSPKPNLAPTPIVAAKKFRLSHRVAAFHWVAPEPTKHPVLLLHGFATSSAMNWVMTGWINPLLEAGHSVLAFDLPGHGDSGTPEDLEPYNRHALIGYINQLITTVGANKVHILGYSFGSRLGWQYCVEHPERVVSLGLGGTSPKDRLAMMRLDQVDAYLEDQSPITDPLTKSLMTIAETDPSKLAARLKLIRAAQRWPYDPETDVPDVPIVAVTGEKDQIAQDSPVMIEIAAANGHPNEFHWVPGRDHINVTSSRLFKDKIIEFFRRHDGRQK
ncbi:alpha/beta fold hydrolase [Micrococcoides hystricis]|uniref:Alpha/beta fold hydrolase n=1 Tax=Micrococcoides hystricis TaxID=1572761 RepID=A0ABV6PBY1_9MICC